MDATLGLWVNLVFQPFGVTRRRNLNGEASRTRGRGFESRPLLFVHVCIDDASRVAYVEVLTPAAMAAWYPDQCSRRIRRTNSVRLAGHVRA